MSGEQDDGSPQVSQEVVSERDSFVAGRDVNITFKFGNAQEAAEVLAGLSSATTQAARPGAEAGIPVLPGAAKAIPRPRGHRHSRHSRADTVDTTGCRPCCDLGGCRVTSFRRPGEVPC